MNFFDRIKKYDDYNMAEILNYASKGIINFIAIFSILSLISGFFIATILLNHWSGDIYTKLVFFLMLSSEFLLFTILGYYWCFKPIRYYEKTHGKTGLGNKYIKKWEGLRENA